MAAVGQGILLHIYEKIFAEYGQATAQLLLTKADLEHRQRFLNARNTLLTLLKLGVIPIVNENDTVAFEEIKFGDNDTLAALVGTLIDADLVILLTDIDGFYDGDPASARMPSASRWWKPLTRRWKVWLAVWAVSLAAAAWPPKLQQPASRSTQAFR